MKPSTAQNPPDDLLTNSRDWKTQVFTTGMIAQICTMAPRTVSKRFDEGERSTSTI